MCSICGYVELSGVASKVFINDSFDLMRHRGPEFEDVLIKGNFCIAHQRLSIIDTSDDANQPMTSGAGAISFNGEIYNYRELKSSFLSDEKFNTSSDTEVLLKFLNKYGLKKLSKLNGMWSFAWMNNVNNSLILCRDRFGIKPLYYLIQEGVLYFSSEMKPLIKIKNNLSKNTVAYSSFINDSASDYDENTFIEGIYQIKPGHFMEIKDGNVNHFQWYYGNDFKFDKLIFNDKNRTLRFTEDLLTKAIDLRLRSDVPLCITLSGGLDSTVLYVLMKERLGVDIQPFTFVHPNSPTSEEEKASMLAKKYGDSIKKIVVENYDDVANIRKVMSHLEFPAWGVSSLAYMATYKKIKEANYTVVIEGHGSDELLGGYPYMLMKAFSESLKKGHLFFAFKIYRIVLATLNPDLQQRRYAYYVTRLIQNMFKKSHLEGSVVSRDISSFDSLMNDAFSYKILPIVLRTFDRLTMANTLESRCPFMDYRVVELFKALPLKYKVNSIGSKAILREILKKYDCDFIYKDKKKIGFSLDEPKFYNNKKNKKFIKKMINCLDDSFYDLKQDALILLSKDNIDWSKKGTIWLAFSLGLLENEVFKKN